MDQNLLEHCLGQFTIWASIPEAQYVVGNLEIRNGEKVLKTYTAIATLTDQSEFSETLTEMRRRGLTAVRDNIEAQMYLDSEFLKNLPRQ